MTHTQASPLLLVESDPSSRAALETILSRRHHVNAFDTGAAAMRFLALGDMPCLILCVPRDGDDSADFRAAQQNSPEWLSIPTVMFSAQNAALSSAFVDALLALAGRHCEVVQ